jgi:hypothetical protein
MFARELVSTFGGARVGALKGSMSQTFTAAGTTQAAATAITTVFTYVTTASEGQGAVLPAGMDNSDQCTVCNSTSVDVYVYPPSGGKINGSSANTPIMLPPNSAIDFTCVDGTNWIANK